ncbi:hypothetical protein QFZ65_002523 [Arthrobacter sp. B3I9]|nr:hypothetical protein [Arthrobacter sp. B3I9]
MATKAARIPPTEKKHITTATMVLARFLGA